MAIDALSSALAGLGASQARIDTVSRNVANAQTDGYTKKTQQQTTDALGQTSLTAIQRSVDEALLNSVRASIGTTNSLDATVTLLSRIETVFGSAEANSSLSSAITGLQTAFQDLSVNPEKGALYNAVIDAGNALARGFHTIYDAAEGARADALKQLQDGVKTVNTTLQSIAEVNQQIVNLSGTGADVTDLEDQRDRLLTTLGGLMDVTTFKKPDGSLAVYTRTGQPLVDATVTPLAVSAAGAIQTNAPPTPPATITPSSGTLGGLLTVRNTTLPALETQLDDIARAVTVEFQNIGVELFNDGGGTTFVVANQVGYADRIAVNNAIVANPTLIRDGASATPLAAGDTTNIDQALAIFNKTNIAFTVAGLPATGGLAQVATDFVAGQAALRQAAENSLNSEKSVQQTLQNRVSAQTGVNVDDEVAQLTVLQQAYAANARVMQTTRELFTTLFNAISA
jgi:flagellar hook-associated protein 1 FlgK